MATTSNARNRVDRRRTNLHIDNFNNPHRVTAEQLGLGSLANGGGYTKSEVDALLSALEATLLSQISAQIAAAIATLMDNEYIFVQTTLASQWVINHQLDDQYPFVQVFDDLGNEVQGHETYTDNNNLTIDFVDPVSGFAKISAGITNMPPPQSGTTTNSVTSYRSSYELDGYLYVGYIYNGTATITRQLNGVVTTAQGVTDLETDWTNRTSLTYA